jgi:hypothetical protein
MRQTFALFVDAYRELNARKLFWIVILLSLLVAGVLACIGIDEKGITVLWWSVEAPFFNTSVITPATFYKSILFVPVGFEIWLTWVAAILALISTASIIPDFVSSGSIELTLSKPIGRLRLFLTKYATGLLFVALQVTVFSVAAFLVIGIRGGSWEPKLFLAIPLVVLFFSYLYSACALFGLLTRSAIASLLLTGLLWAMIFLVHFGESGVLLPLKATKEHQVKQSIAKIERLTNRIEQLDGEIAKLGDEAGDAAARDQKTRVKGLREGDLSEERPRLAAHEKDLSTLTRVHNAFYITKSVLPKTSETMGLLERSITQMSDLQGIRDAAANGRRNRSRVDLGSRDGEEVEELRVAERVDEEMRKRSVAWIIGSSLLFEGLLLGIASLIFVRRDF